MSTKLLQDLIVIGGGPAGLSAALAMSRVLRPCTIIDSHVYRNAKSPAAHTVPGVEGIDPAVWRQNVRKELEPFVREGTLKFVDGEVKSAKGSNGNFEVGLTNGELVRGKKILFATGIEDMLPPIPGFAELWGTKIIHCVYCHGYEFKGRKVGALLDPNGTFVNFALIDSLTKKFIPRILTNTPLLLNRVNLDSSSSGLHPDQVNLIKTKLQLPLYSAAVASFEPTATGLIVHFSDSSALSLDAILSFALPRIPHSIRSLAEDLGVKIGVPAKGIPGVEVLLTEEGETGKTDVEGVYAAGNCASVIANVPIAVSMGLKAGIMATFALEKEEEEQ